MANKNLTAVILICSILFSCGGKKDETNVEAPEGMHTLNLSKYGKPFSIFVPDTVKTKLTISEQTTGALEIKVGPSFAVAINEQIADLELLKSDLKSDEVNKLKSMIVEEPTALMWESEVVQPEYHFVLNKKINNADYSFEDIKNTEAEPFTKDAIKRMLDACKDVQGVKK